MEKGEQGQKRRFISSSPRVLLIGSCANHGKLTLRQYIFVPSKSDHHTHIPLGSWLPVFYLYSWYVPSNCWKRIANCIIIVNKCVKRANHSFTIILVAHLLHAAKKTPAYLFNTKWTESKASCDTLVDLFSFILPSEFFIEHFLNSFLLLQFLFCTWLATQFGFWSFSHLWNAFIYVKRVFFSPLLLEFFTD